MLLQVHTYTNTGTECVHLFYRGKGSVSKSEVCEVPRMAATFPLCTATAIFCLRWYAEGGSRVESAMRWPESLMKLCASGPKSLSVSMAVGRKQ